MSDFASRMAQRADQARSEVLLARREVTRMTNAQADAGCNWMTAEARQSRLTVTLSIREALALVRVTGPMGNLNTSGSAARLLAALHITQQAVLRAPGGNRAVAAALDVLQATLNDMRWECRDSYPMPEMPVRPQRGRPRRKAVA